MTTTSRRLEGKVAFITGAARGQGRAHAVRMAQEGADIVAIDIAGPIRGIQYPSSTEEELAETVRLVEEAGGRIASHVADVRDLEALKRAADDAVERFGGLDIVVANAAICIASIWDETTPEIYQDQMDINVTGVWNTVMATAHHLVNRGGGSVVMISSYAGKKVQPFMVPYTASKHAVVGMARAFAAELGKHNIRVNSVHPGSVNSAMGSIGMRDALDKAAETNPPLALMGTSFLPVPSAEPEDIANAVAFLASDESKFITSEHISVDGGKQYY